VPEGEEGGKGGGVLREEEISENPPRREAGIGKGDLAKIFFAYKKMSLASMYKLLNARMEEFLTTLFFAQDEVVKN